jgi:hypothetical protein
MTLREVLAAVADGYAVARDAVMGFGTKILDTDVVSILPLSAVKNRSLRAPRIRSRRYCPVTTGQCAPAVFRRF